MRSIDKEKKSKQSLSVKGSNASKKLHVKMEHCFGIGELEHTFDFTKGNVMTVYAHNGVGKSSFCKAMELYAKGLTEEIRDELYGEKQNVATVVLKVFELQCYLDSQSEYTEYTPPRGTIKIADESGDVEPKCIKVFGRNFDRTFTANEMMKMLRTESVFVPLLREVHVISFVTKMFQQLFGIPVWFCAYEEPTEDGVIYKLFCDVETAEGQYEHYFTFEEFQKAASNGERRAVNFLYFLMQLNKFAIERLKDVPGASWDMLKGYVILDDIADMFDSRNRMAMAEFLRNITARLPNVRWIFFSHNCDVYRYLSNRLCVAKENRFVATKRSEGGKNIVTLSRDYYAGEGDPFRNWAKNIDNKKKFLALIPFVRQLVLFTRDEDRSTSDSKDNHAKNKEILTHLLHYFPQGEDEKGTEAITVEEIVGIFKNYIDFDESKINFRVRTIFDLLLDTCNTIVETKEEAQGNEKVLRVTEIDLVNKVVLAIGIRLLAEEYMLREGATAGENSNRMCALYDSFKKKHGNDPSKGEAIRKLVLCTAFLPDFIHMNSFHYEPLMDLEGSELAEYYQCFKELTEAENEHA